ncbi:hypothetical protein DF19_29710 [Streptomyces olindensis]|nr:hypothetical protein DF19_29710 [Streptomyces olindensis]
MGDQVRLSRPEGSFVLRPDATDHFFAGPWQCLALPVFTTLRGYAGLAAGGMLPTETAEHGLDDVIAYILRGCAPD